MTVMTWKSRLAAVAALMILCIGAGSPVARADEKVNLKLDVSVGGVRAFKVNYQAKISDTAYTSTVRAKPVGLVKLFVNLNFDMDAQGRVSKNAVAPKTFKMVTKKKKKKKSYEVTWPPGGKPVTKRSKERGAKQVQAIQNALKPTIPDPLTMLLNHSIYQAAKPCSRTERVYDGKEVYDLKFSFGKTVSLGNHDRGIYRGKAYQCTIQYIPVAGLKPKDLAEAKANPTVFHVLFAQAQSKALGRTVLVPISASGDLDGKSFTATATAATLSGKPLNSKSRAKR